MYHANDERGGLTPAAVDVDVDVGVDAGVDVVGVVVGVNVDVGVDVGVVVGVIVDVDALSTKTSPLLFRTSQATSPTTHRH